MFNIFNIFGSSGNNLDIFGPLTSTPELLFNHTVESLTRDVEIKPLHSHNDYWRKEPLFDALSYGFQSIESDIWYFPEGYIVERTATETTETKRRESKKDIKVFKSCEVYVGHNQVYLEPENTLFNLYLNPLYQYLTYSNPEFKKYSSSNYDPQIEKVDSKHGIFYNSPETPLYFWLDFKTDANSTYKALKPYLQRFIDKGYLAYYDTTAKKYVPGPIVITITGNLPIDLVEKETKRYVFLDAPLKIFNSKQTTKDMQRFSELSVIASGSLQELLGYSSYSKATRNDFDKEQRAVLKSYFDFSHSYGLKTRIWGGINWPNQLRNLHLKALFEEGCDLLNVDDLAYASKSF